MPVRTIESANARARDLEERLEELRHAVQVAIVAHEAGEEPELIFGKLRRTFEHVPPGKWDATACIAKAHEWEEQYGEPPASINWNPHGLKQRGRPEQWLEAFYEGDWPSEGTIRRIFGKWNAFMVAAGYEPRSNRGNRSGPGGGKGLEHLPEWHGWQVISGYRDRMGLTQTALAERAQLSMNYVGNIERGEQTNPTVRLLLALARALQVSGGVLLDDAGQDATGVRGKATVRRG